MGNEFWLAPRPHAEAAPAAGVRSSMEFIYYCDDPPSIVERPTHPAGRLLLPEAFRSAAVHAGLAEALKNRDDSDQAYYEELYMKTDQPNMLSASQAIGENTRIKSGPLADITRRVRGRVRDYDRRSDGYGSY